jgi:hypothetical protein
MAVICFYLFANTMGYIVKRTHEGYSRVAYIHFSTDILLQLSRYCAMGQTRGSLNPGKGQ